jgi:phage tail sheath protein FI
MPTYLHPGVYVEEIPSGAKPIEAVGTSIAAFVGAVKKGPAGEPELIHSWDDYQNTFGPIASSNDAMGLAVSAFYLNGGKDAYVARLVSTSPPAAASTLTVDGEGAGVGGVLVVTATSVGTWGNEVYIRIVKPNVTDLNFTLEVGHLEQNEFVADETFSNVNMNANSDNYILTQVNDTSQLVTVSLADGVAGHYQNGLLTGAAMGDGGTVFSDADDGMQDNMTLSINIDGLGVKRITLGTADSFGFTDSNADDGDSVANALQLVVQALGPQESYASFNCEYNAEKFVLTSGTSSSSSSVVVYDGDGFATDLTKFLNLDSASETVSVHGSANVVPIALAGVAGQGEHLDDGVESAPTSAEYKTFFSTKLKKIHDVSIIVLPGQYMPENGFGNTIISEALAHAEETKSRMVIVDPPPGEELDQSTKVDKIGLSTSTYGVLYYPWVKVANPFYNADTNPNVNKTLPIAPSAFAAGMWSKIDGRRGVWKAPAGLETSLLGVAGLEFTVGDGDQNQLNPMGVNCLRKMPGAGPVIWGSRTLSTKADPEWRYVPVRRTAIFIEQSIYNGIQWAVFEPNDHRLWSSLRLNIDSFMNGLFRSGAFQGEKASDAYFVRCGLGDTMTQGDIDRGQVIVIVGFAPLKPAEFVIVRIQQKVAQQ